MYLALPVSSGGFLQAIRVLEYSGVRTKKLCAFRLRDYHPLWCWFPTTSSIHTICNFSSCERSHPTTPFFNFLRNKKRFGLICFRSPLLTEFLLVSFPRGTEMFHFPRYTYAINLHIIEVHSMRFPHSEILGSNIVRHIPQAYRRHTASFVAILNQGIHRMLLLSY